MEIVDIILFGVWYNFDCWVFYGWLGLLIDWGDVILENFYRLVCWLEYCGSDLLSKILGCF